MRHIFIALQCLIATTSAMAGDFALMHRGHPEYTKAQADLKGTLSSILRAVYPNDDWIVKSEVAQTDVSLEVPTNNTWISALERKMREKKLSAEVAWPQKVVTIRDQNSIAQAIAQGRIRVARLSKTENNFQPNIYLEEARSSVPIATEDSMARDDQKLEKNAMTAVETVQIKAAASAVDTAQHVAAPAVPSPTPQKLVVAPLRQAANLDSSGQPAANPSPPQPAAAPVSATGAQASQEAPPKTAQQPVVVVAEAAVALNIAKSYAIPQGSFREAFAAVARRYSLDLVWDAQNPAKEDRFDRPITIDGLGLEEDLKQLESLLNKSHTITNIDAYQGNAVLYVRSL